MNRRTILSFVACAWLFASVLAPTPVAAADSVTECIAANERFVDLRKQGKLIDARKQLALCAASTCPDAIQQACRARIADLNGSIPSVVFDVKDPAGRDLMDVGLSVDGQPAGLVGVTALPVDPGQHTFRFEAKGQPPVERVLVLREGDRDRRESVVIGQAGATSPKEGSQTAVPGSTVSDATASIAATPTPADATTGASARKTRQWIGLAVGGAGVLAMGVGGALALVAKSSYDGAPGCTGSTCSSTEGINATNSARNLGDVATVTLLAGAAVAGAGLVLWITAPKDSTSAARPRRGWSVGVTFGGAAVKAGF